MLLPIILSGGFGSRLWPQSRSSCPKQFMPLLNELTLFQSTLKRLDGLESVLDPLIIASEEHRFIVAEQLRQIDVKASSIVLEPERKNTAPAIALAAMEAMINGGDPVLLVLPSDHIVQGREVFQRAVNAGLPLAEKGKLVTFGVVPSRAESGYGYIKVTENDLLEGDCSYKIQRFVEKPSKEKAEQFIQSGEYYWNSGMFMFRASCYLKALQKEHFDISTACKKAMNESQRDLDFLRVGRSAFKVCPSQSIDYAVMEKTRDAVMVPLNTGWSDVGSWSSLYELSDKDPSGNAIHGDVVLENSGNSYVRSDTKLIAGLGIENLFVIESGDAILIAHKDRLHDLKSFVQQLKDKGRVEADTYRKVHRPWGICNLVDEGEGFKVKRITVLPGMKLPLQRHLHRAEQWVVVKGTAFVTNDDEQMSLTENQSTYIPVGVLHRLENRSESILELIEVQTGKRLEESDI